MGTKNAFVAGRVQRQVISVVCSVVLAALIVRHSAARKAEERNAR
jgi:hypothetical protein